MKIQIVLTTLLLGLSTLYAVSQTQLPKVRVSKGFFVTRYELGEKFVPEKQVLNHFKATNEMAYMKLETARNFDVGSTLCYLIGSGLLIGGLVSNSSNAGPLLIAGVSFDLVGLVLGISSGVKRDKSVDIYNKAAGY